MAVKKQGKRLSETPSEDADVQSVLGRIAVSRSRWQTIVDVSEGAPVYRIFNSIPRDPGDIGNSITVRFDDPPRTLKVFPGASVDIQSKLIIVRAGAEGTSENANGWYLQVS